MAKTAPKHFFSHNPSVNTQRTMFDMSKTDTVTLNPDYYYPNYKLLVIPGDTVVLSYSNMIRLLDSLEVPMMDNLYCDTHFWFVPFDCCWDYTKNFFGEKKRPSDPDISTLPVIQFTSSTLPQVGSVYDYFGIPVVGTDGLLSGSFDVQAMPLLSYYLIHDDWIRDEQRVNYLLDTPDFTKTTFAPTDFTLYKRGKRFDYFTSTLLSPNLGSPVNLNMAGVAPVFASSIINTQYLGATPDTPTGTPLAPLNFAYAIGADYASVGYDLLNSTTAVHWPAHMSHLNDHDGVILDRAQSSTATISGNSFTPINLKADLRGATSVSVEQLRRAFQVQAYQELLARGGNRYPEYIYTMYNVVNPDQALGRAEFLGSTHQRLSVQPVVQTNDSSSAPLGNLGAFVSGGVTKDVFTRSFTRFGYIIGCINIYADLTYYQGLEKDWSLLDRMDFPVNVFANLTDQPVYKKEILLTGQSSDNDVFGYQEIYSWAKYSQNSLRGLVRPNVSSSIGYWSLAETFTSVPVNNDTFITSNTPIDRITAVNTSGNVHHFICNQKFDVKLTRELPQHSDPMKWMFRA